MCGIAGIIKFPNAPPPPWHGPVPNFSQLEKMSNALAHRGPDGHGTFTDPRPHTTAALLHRRLAILDLPCGHQPMPNESATLHVVFNGEIYNHADLRRQLQHEGHTFTSDHSDTEVLVHGYEEWGPDLPSKLRGMFAFALWDARPDPATGRPADTLFLARDRMGQKPLFYATLEDGIVFGSTIPSVLAWPEVPRRVPLQQIALYLQKGYLPAPQTIFRDISSVLPGHFLQLKKDVLTGGAYWPPPSANKIIDEEDRATLQDSLRQRVERAVDSQLIADVPIACFLSGGIDSSIIAATMQKLLRAKNAAPLRTVSVGFAEAAFDETAFAVQVAEKIGSAHTRLQVDPALNVLDTLRTLMRDSLGQPFADSSLLPTYHLSKAVRDLAPVALSGDGADELFGGYDRYRATTLLQKISPLAPLLPRSLPWRSLKKRERYRRLARAARESTPHDRYARLMDIFPPEDIALLLGTPPDLDAAPHSETAASPFRQARLADQHDYLPNDVLWKVDAASMQCALEVRAPFLDHPLVEFANTLPDALLRHGRTGKVILRDAFAADLPPALFTRAKQGFAVPIGHWFNTTLRSDLTNLLTSPTSFTAQHLAKPEVARLLDEHQRGTRDHTHRLFALLMLELFWSEFKPTLEP